MTDRDLLELLVDGQKGLRTEIRELGERLEKKIDSNSERLDKLGLAIAELEDDAPTRQEFEELENEVQTIKQKLSLA